MSAMFSSAGKYRIKFIVKSRLVKSRIDKSRVIESRIGKSRVVKSRVGKSRHPIRPDIIIAVS